MTSTQESVYDVISVNFNSKKVHEDVIFVRQDIAITIFLRRIQSLQIFKIPIDVICTLMQVEFYYNVTK